MRLRKYICVFLLSFTLFISSSFSNADDFATEIIQLKEMDTKLDQKLDKIIAILEKQELERQKTLKEYENQRREAMEYNERLKKQNEQVLQTYEKQKEEYFEHNEKIKQHQDEWLKEYEKAQKKAIEYNENLEYNLKENKSYKVVPDGVQKEFYPNGSIKSEATYVNGKIEGIQKHFHENGNLYMETEFKNGKIAGEQKIYRKDGSLYQVSRYKESELVEFKILDKDGKILLQK